MDPGDKRPLRNGKARRKLKKCRATIDDERQNNAQRDHDLVFVGIPRQHESDDLEVMSIALAALSAIASILPVCRPLFPATPVRAGRFFAADCGPAERGHRRVSTRPAPGPGCATGTRWPPSARGANVRQCARVHSVGGVRRTGSAGPRPSAGRCRRAETRPVATG